MKKAYLFCFIIFSLISNYSSSQYTHLYSFQSTPDGSLPSGSLVSDGTFLYGMTPFGGTGVGDVDGTIFKIMLDGTGYLKLLDFNGVTNGSNPNGSLIFDGAFLYGMTRQGGINDLGTIFKILPDGTGYVKLFDFAGATNGEYPEGSLFSDGTFLYGMTLSGGIYNLGTVFKIKPDGSNYTKLLDFSGVINGSSPVSSLISDGTYLYGCTAQGGTNNLGTIFKILPDGSNYTKLLDFSGVVNGSAPRGDLYYDGSFLYGMTWQGGTSYNGTIFKIMPDGSGYQKLLDFESTTNGKYPNGSLITDGTFLYGMTYMGGTSNNGTLFKIMTNGTGFTKLWDFSVGENGRGPLGTLMSDGSNLYGMTKYGGTPSNYGVIFKYGLTAGIEEGNTDIEFSIYPNPTSGIIELKTSANGEQLVLITNIMGEEVYSKEYQLNSEIPFTIDLSEQFAGMYYLRIGNCTQKIIKL